ncbi:MAG: cyclic pyranopterin monophosphate synthase MoaC [Candidatus Eisenbacteria bacterium]|nr:cyclic pyranopterin monophosphate synthase MoaC [Candidatus Eisenbacteria bacterium]
MAIRQRTTRRPSAARSSRGPSVSLSHVGARGEARMVDVGEKATTRRSAIARGLVTIGAVAARAVRADAVAKGNVLEVARLAGIQGAKRTAELIPLCHPLAVDHIAVDCRLVGRTIRIEAVVSIEARTGVEMEALTAVSVAALTIYDMLKAVEKGIEIGPIHLLEKRGGRSGVYRREPRTGAPGPDASRSGAPRSGAPRRGTTR